jgi:hypothetical protein
MDIKNLLAESKARFNHNSAKAYLSEKFNSKLLVAEQGGLWRADAQTISFLNSMDDNNIVILIDTFNSPVQVNREELLTILKNTYNTVMVEWYKEWKELESKR